MNEKEFLYSRCAVNTTYMDVGSADIASLHGCNLLGQCRSYCRGANICRPCRLDCSVHATVNLEYRKSFSYVYLKTRKGLLNNFKITFQFPLRNMFAKFPFFPFTTRRKMFNKILTKILSGHCGLFKTLCCIP